MKKTNRFSVLIYFLSLSLALSAQQGMDTAVIKTVKIKDHIHMLQWGGAGNMLLLSGSDGNILVDDQFAPLSEKINKSIQDISKGAVKFLVNTHFHGDHAGGNENFAKMGATILAHDNVRARLSGDSTKVKFAKKPTPSVPKAFPVITFNDKMNLHFNGEDILVFHVNNAHTDGDAVLYLPKSNVIHTGDCYMRERFPYIDRNNGGSVKGWLSAVSKILAVIDDQTIVMPGHGDLSTKKEYQGTRDAVAGLFQSVRREFNSGKNLTDILALKLSEPFDKTYGSGFIKGPALVTTIVQELTDDSEWKELINGKDFSGWKVNTENKETWTVVDGTFQAVGKRAHIFYEGEHLKDGFKNFEIEVQVKTFKLANSGIYIHTKYQDVGWPSQGMEIQVNNSHLGEGDYVEWKRMGSLYGTRNIYRTFSKDDMWMTVKARVESNRVQIWVDGVKTVDYLQNDAAKGVRKLSVGTFALQGHDSLSKMQYRSFRVRRLPDDAKSDLVAPTFGAWFDSLRVYQNRGFAFIDLNPQSAFLPNELADYTYKTGINAALVSPITEVVNFSAAQNFPIFTGIKVNAKNLKDLKTNDADYVLGESDGLKSAKALLSSGKIQIWSHKGAALKPNEVEVLLTLAKQNNVAIEIDNAAKTPSVNFIKLAKEKGCKFTFSGLMPIAKLESSIYILEAISGAGLNYKDLFVPKW